MAANVRPHIAVRLPGFQLLTRLCLMLSVLVGLAPLGAPVAHADSCGFQPAYGPYGAQVGVATPDLTFAITKCPPDTSYVPFFGVDNRPRIDWGDGSGWQTTGVGLGDCGLAAFCAVHGGGHTYGAAGTYTAHVKYYSAGWYTADVAMYVYPSPAHTAIDPANWMGTLGDQLRNVKLNALTFPGTHDSGAYGFTAQSLTAPDFPLDLASPIGTWAGTVKSQESACPAIITVVCKASLDSVVTILSSLSGSLAATRAGTNLSATLPKIADYIAAQSNAQDRDIAQQLNDGIRYLDLRLCAPVGSVSEVTLCHGVYSPAGITLVLKQIHDFVVAHPSEIVIVDLNHFYGVDGKNATAAQRDAVIRQIRSVFTTNPADPCNTPATCLLVPSSFTPQSTLDSIWKTPGRVILVDNDSTTRIGAEDVTLYPQNPVFWQRSAVMGGEWIQLDDPNAYRDTALRDLLCRCDVYTATHGGTSTSTSSMFFGVGADLSPSADWVASTLVQRLVQKDAAINSNTVGAALMSAILQAADRPDLIVDPATSANEVLRQRARLANALILNGLYAGVMRGVAPNGDLVFLDNANIISTDWYEESRLVDIAIALNMARSTSVTLFSDANYGGRNFVSTTSVPNLSGTPIGNNQASSVLVGHGTMVSAYSTPNYTGTCQTFGPGGTPDLASTRIGNDSIESIKLGEACPADHVTGDITLCANENTFPPCVYIRDNVPDFGVTAIGNDNVRSLGVPAGGTMSLFSDANYRGMCVTSTGGLYNELRSAGMSAKASSMLANQGCPVSDDDRGVVLYDGITFTGDHALFTHDVPDLNAFGLNDRVSSLAVSRGIVVTLFADANYQGTCMSFSANTVDLRNTRFGNDTASSLRVGTSSPCSSV
jgi:hypothetical protein